ncbi:hypothetical protein GCM10009836_70460 [Pseudonocardia ailaonensis]|uniref:N-acetyltransferase domain-containing protein n=1 Tax=Pseudonocardia ailaonensis TaxID=367279 RepID=A0ABN2NNY0_9PSEU
MTSHLRIRPGRPSDAAFLVEMARFASVIEDRPLPPPDDPELQLPSSPDAVVVAEPELGAAWWTFVEPPLVAGAPELVVAVTPTARGRGLGGALLDALAARAAEAGHHHLALNVHIRNPAARLYSRTGFVVAGKGRGPLGVAMVRQL